MPQKKYDLRNQFEQVARRYNNEEERAQAAEKAAYLWNQGKVVSLSPGE